MEIVDVLNISGLDCCLRLLQFQSHVFIQLTANYRTAVPNSSHVFSISFGGNIVTYHAETLMHGCDWLFIIITSFTWDTYMRVQRSSANGVTSDR